MRSRVVKITQVETSEGIGTWWIVNGRGFNAMPPYKEPYIAIDASWPPKLCKTFFFWKLRLLVRVLVNFTHDGLIHRLPLCRYDCDWRRRGAC